MAEKAGIRSVSVVTKAFMGQAAAISGLLGLDLPIAEYPGVITTDDDETFERTVVDEVVPGILAGLAREQHQPPPPKRPSPSRIVVRGDLDAIQRDFDARMWTDGLPIVPPTINRVEQFLAHTHHGRDDVLGIALPMSSEATVWGVAVNGVMAGCPPELMPVLVAAVEVLTHPDFRLQDAGSTPGWEPLAIVSGPVVRELDFNFGPAALRIGRKANSSLGRFVRLYMRNVAGLRIPPGDTDKASIGQGLNVALAEDEESVRAAGWSTYAEERGFGSDDSVVTLQSVRSMSAPIYLSGVDLDKYFMYLADALAGLGGPGSLPSGMRNHGTHHHALIVMTPAIMDAFARRGVQKPDIRREISQRARLPLAKLLEYGSLIDLKPQLLQQLVDEGTIPEVYVRPDPDGTVPIFPWPEQIDIVVAGDPGRNQTRCYTTNHMQGPPTSQRVDFRR
jgi:hypothetical protein